MTFPLRFSGKMGFVEKALLFRESLRRLVLGWVSPSTLRSEKMRAELNQELKTRWPEHTIDVYELIIELNDRAINTDPTGTTSPAVENEAYIVFIDADIDVDWIAKTDPSANACKLISYAESIGAKRCKHLPPEQALEFKRLVGQAVANGIREDGEECVRLGREAAKFLKDRTVERSRSWTLTSAHAFAIILTLLIGLTASQFILTYAEEIQEYFFAWASIQGGLMGAYLSVIDKAGRGEWDAAAGKSMHYIETFSKLFAGSVLGAMAYALARSVHAPSYFKTATTDICSVMVIGFCAGLFERTIPKMISTYSTVSNQQPTQTSETQSNLN
jgi:hypothetical protein